jgi:thiol-disulfide isomerase/thioredoxin
MKKIIFCTLLFPCIAALGDAPVPTKADNLNGAAFASADTPEMARAVEIQKMLMAINKGGDKSQAAWDAIEAKIESYQKDFGADPSNKIGIIRNAQLNLAKKFAELGGYQALLQKLEADSIPAVADMAKQVAALDKQMEDLKSKPMDLKFTAVDGTAVDLAQMHGKVVLIDFWATWCLPCQAEVPNVVAAYKKYHDQGFEIVGISLDQDKTALLAFTKKSGMVWPQYFDGTGWNNKISKGFGIQGIPAMWLVDQKGMLVTTNGRDDLAGQVGKLLSTDKTSPKSVSSN